MDIKELKEYIVIIDEKNDDNIKLRNQYINAFINTEKPYYKNKILTTHMFSDGECYTGYLWDCLKNPININFNEVLLKKKYIGNVYVLWDIHSKDRIFIKDYWKFDKTSIIETNYSIVLGNLENFPEDIYIFDNTFKWTIIFTHEFIQNDRWCLLSGEI